MRLRVHDCKSFSVIHSCDMRSFIITVFTLQHIDTISKHNNSLCDALSGDSSVSESIAYMSELSVSGPMWPCSRSSAACSNLHLCHVATWVGAIFCCRHSYSIVMTFRFCTYCHGLTHLLLSLLLCVSTHLKFGCHLLLSPVTLGIFQQASSPRRIAHNLELRTCVPRRGINYWSFSHAPLGRSVIPANLQPLYTWHFGASWLWPRVD